MNMNIHQLKAKDPKRFDKEYEEWCQHEPYDNWWEYTYDVAKEDGKSLGFDIEKIMFSGFSSQGDGASWTGYIDLLKYIKADVKLVQEPAYNILAALIEGDWLESEVKIDTGVGHYCHEHTMSVGDIEMYTCEDDGVIEHGVYKGVKIEDLYDAMGELFLEEFNNALQEHARDFATDIYRRLEKEYDYLRSEESFIESCECNDVEFEDEYEED